MKNKKNTGIYIFMAIVMLVAIIPILSSIIIAIENKDVLNLSFSDFLLNSAIISVITTIVAVFISFFAAYAIARLDFSGKKLIIALVALPLFVPQIMLATSKEVILLSYFSFAIPVGVFCLVYFFRKIPINLERKAILDGASRFKAIFKVFLPEAWTSLVITNLIVLIVCFDELLFSLALNSEEAVKTAVVAASMQISVGELALASIIISIPAIIAIFIIQGILYKTK